MGRKQGFWPGQHTGEAHLKKPGGGGGAERGGYLNKKNKMGECKNLDFWFRHDTFY